jgi:dolichyl-phosphate-mannose-protein mannosyltransferase
MALILLIVFHLVTNLIWISANERGPFSDEKNYFNKSIRIYQLCGNPGLDFFPRLFKAPPAFRPPLFPLCVTPLYLVGGISYRTACFTNTIFLAIIIIFIFKIGKLLYTPSAGLLAAFIVSFCPFMLKYSHLLFSEMCLTAVLSIGFWLLLKTGTFRDRRYSIWLGLVMGAGMLIKQTYLFFIVLPVAFEGIKGVLSRENFRPDRYDAVPHGSGGKKIVRFTPAGVNLLLSILIAAAVSLPYYLICSEEIKAMRIMNIIQESSIPLRSVLTVKHFFWGFTALGNLTGLFFFILFIIGLAGSFKAKYRKKLLLLAWLAGGGGLTFLFLKDRTRYFFPLLPACALISSFWIIKIKNLIIKRAVFILLIINSALIYIWMTWGVSLFNLYPRPVSLIFPDSDYQLDIIPRPRPPIIIGDWKIKTIMDVIAADAGGRNCNLLVIPLLVHFTPEYFQSLILIEKMPIEIFQPTWSSFDFNTWTLSQADYILTKTGPIRIEYATPDFREEFAQFLRDPPPAWKNSHSLIKEFELPDNSKAMLYKRILPLSAEERRQILEEAIKIDPDNKIARRELLKISRTLSPEN